MRKPSAETGVVNTILGFDLYVYDDAPIVTLNASGDAISSVGDHNTTKAAKTSSVGIFGSAQAMRYGFSNVKTFVAQSPGEGANIMSINMYGGATSSYSDASGIALLTEAIAT